ncbi:MAG: aminotransferase class I/II-fold pyridoxal phosphate-dependent enzyme [Caldilineaceae bacterium]|nr:aminotransferase class I/II-fold pyridoxal phosphate-dependent enzyme [Caldilineaceae bacterium]
MHVNMHKLFETFLHAHALQPEASVVFSLATPARLGDYLADLDPEMKLDWSDQSFQGLPSLREKVVDRMGYAPVCSADNVLITAGTNEANFLAITQLVEAGDEMIFDVPGWPQPLALGEAIGAVVKELPRYEEKGWEFEIDELAALITDKTKLIYLCNPNNPTGHVLSEDTLKAVAQLAERVGAYVLCDEVYRGLEWHGAETPRIANFYERGISTGSISKIFGMQGLRTGWMVCRDPNVILDAMVLRENTSEIMNVMGEAIADIVLREDRFAPKVAQVRAAEAQNMDLLDQFIAEMPMLAWHRPQAGLIGFCRIDLPIDADTFAKRLLDPPYRTFVMSGNVYNYPQHIRLGVGGGAAAGLDVGLARMKELLYSI